ncbi:MAG: TonB-dependent receptor [bacterium]|nr:TonB-dependent receptor [bacterium]
MMRTGFHARLRAGGVALAAALLVLALESAMVLPAQGTTVVDDYTSLSLEQLMAIPVYSAAKREQKTSEAPSSVTVVTSQDVRAHGWRTLSELLRSVPGIYVSNTRTYGSVGVRGFERSGDFGGRVLLLVNGHRMNDPLYDSAATVEDFILDLDLIDRVEIVRGPGSTLYGTNAFFAVINVITKRADQFEGFEASGEIGTFDAARGRLTFGTRGDDGSETVLSASGFTSDGKAEVYMPRYDGDPVGFDGRLRGGDGESATRYMGSHRRGGLTIEGFYVGRDKDTPPSYGTVYYLPRHTFDARAFVEARYEHALSAKATLAARLYYDWYKYVGTYQYDLEDPDFPEFLVNKDFSQSESVGGELQLSLKPASGHAATVGLEYRDNYRQLMQNYNVDPRYYWLDIDPATQIFGLYAQDEYRPSDRLGVTAGLRYDHYDSFGEAVSPRLALVYGLDAATTLKLLYGEAFRAPNANEFYYEEEGVVKRNPDLKPEEIVTYELVCERQFGPNWRGSLAGFLNRATDMIDQLYDENDGMYYFDNSSMDIKARGFELQTDGQLGKSTRVGASYSYTKTEDEATGEVLEFAPEHLFKVNLIAPLLPEAVLAGVEVQYVSDRFNTNDRGYKGHWLVNATLFSHRWKDRWEASLSAYNLFEAEYDRDVIGDFEILQDGRVLRAKVSLRF